MVLKLRIKDKRYLTKEDIESMYSGEQKEALLGMVNTMMAPFEEENLEVEMTIDSSVFESCYISTVEEDTIVLYTKSNGEYKIVYTDKDYEKIVKAIEFNGEEPLY